MPLGPVFHKRSHRSEEPMTKRSPCLLQLEKAHAKQQRSRAAKKKKKRSPYKCIQFKMYQLWYGSEVFILPFHFLFSGYYYTLDITKCMCFHTGAKMIKHVGDMKYLAQFVPKSISIGTTISLAHLKHHLWRLENMNMFSRSLMVKGHLAAKSMGCWQHVPEWGAKTGTT